MSESGNLVQNVEGDGAPREVSADELAQLKADLTTLSVQQQQIIQQRLSDDQTRFAYWDGMSNDGRKHRDDLGYDPKPFEGASDMRDRMVDMTVRKRGAQLTQAAKRCAIHFEPTDGADQALPGRLDAVLRYFRDVRWGSAHWDEIRKAANYYLSDTPAGVLWFTGWNRHTCLRMSQVKLADVAAFLLRNFAQDGVEPSDADLAIVQGMFENPEFENDAVDLLGQILPHITAPRLRKMVKAIRSDGVAEFPEPYMSANEPAMLAMRFGEDVFAPVNTIRNIQAARSVYVREWLTATQVRDRAISEGWDESFVTALLGEPEQDNPSSGGGAAGQSGLPMPYGSIYQQQTPLAQNLGLYRDFRHLYEVWTAYTRGVDKNGVPGIFVVPFSYFVDQTAKPRELYRSGHGKYPVVWVQREIVNNMLTDSRSLSFLGMSAQRMRKTLADLEVDQAQISALPPLDVPQGMQDQQIVISPLAQNPRQGREPAQFMEMPSRPLALVEMREWIDKQWREYAGLNHPDLDATETAILVQQDIDTFLAGYAEALQMCMQDAQLFLTDEQIKGILGPDGRPIGDTLESIQGKFQMNMVCDTIDFDQDKLIKFCEMFFKYVLPLDTGQTIKRDVVVRWLFNKLNPSMARAAVIPADMADTHEIEEEDEVLALALSGIESPMMEEGQNHALRLQRLQEQLQKSNIQQRVMAAPDTMDILNRRVQHLTQMVTQQQNKVIGRLGAVPKS